MKININNKKLLVSIALAGVILISKLPGREPKLNVTFTKEDSIESVMESISNETELDENYDLVFTNAYNTEATSLEELVIHYNEAYQSERLDVCNEDLYQIGYFLLKQQVADTLGLEMSQIQDFHYDIETIDHHQVEYKVIITYNKDGQIETKKFILTDEGPRIIINLERARVGGFDTLEEVDACYTSFLEFMMTSGKEKGNVIVITYNKDKQEAVKLSRI